MNKAEKEIFKEAADALISAKKQLDKFRIVCNINELKHKGEALSDWYSKYGHTAYRLNSYMASESFKGKKK